MRRLGPVTFRRPIVALAAVGALAVPFGLSATSAWAEPTAPSTAALQHRNVRVCPAALAGQAACYAVLRQAVTASGKPAPSASAPTGLAPATIEAVYGWGSGDGSGQTIAIVDAYDAPNISSDLQTFSSEYNLPQLGACNTGATACFSKVNQTGGTKYPRSNSGWDLEISLDVEWAHAIAPGASILLVEASSNSFTNLMAAEGYAAAHANYVSNSWGSSEFSGESSYDASFTTPSGKTAATSFFVAAGDSGLGAEYPSSSPNVISVGGTSLALTMSGTTVQSALETGWSSGGGGCSSYEQATSAQLGLSTESQVGCGGERATPDVALDADPSSGVSVYDSEGYAGQTGWFQVGGTSAATPMWAARSANQQVTVDSSYVYPSPTYNITYNDILSGNNGAPALPGYDLVTGLGSWIGAGAIVTAGTSSGGSGSGSDSVWVPDGGISYSAAAHGNAGLIQVEVTDSNGPVNGATVSITIVDSRTGAIAAGSGTTGSNGTVTFKLNKVSVSDTYTTTITSITGTNLIWASSSGETSYSGTF